jgi:hypothetical protein
MMGEGWGNEAVRFVAYFQSKYFFSPKRTASFPFLTQRDRHPEAEPKDLKRLSCNNIVSIQIFAPLAL